MRGNDAADVADTPVRSDTAVGSDTVGRQFGHRGPGDQLELSIVMPCLNEARTVRSCIEEARDFLRRRGVVGEIVVADNGSTDRSREIAAELRRAGRGRPRAGVRSGAAGGDRGRPRALRRHGRRRRQLRLRPPRRLPRAPAPRRRARDGQSLPGRHRAWRHAATAPLPRQPGALHPGPAVLRQLDRRLPLRAARVRPGGGPAARPADHGDGVRQRDGRQGELGGLVVSEVPTTLRPDGRSRSAATCAAGATAGGTCGSCCSTRRAGCSSTPASR